MNNKPLPTIHNATLSFSIGKARYRYNFHDKSIVSEAHRDYPPNMTSVNDKMAMEYVEKVVSKINLDIA